VNKRRILTIALAASIGGAPFAVASQAATPAVQPAYGTIWTVDTAANTLSEYGPGSSGAATAKATISGAATGLSSPTGVALDAVGNVYVANAGNDSLTEYAADATGNATPTATIAGPATALDAPSSIAYGNGQLWATDPADNLVEGFTAGTSGNELPAATITGSKTGLHHPVAIATSEDDLWVANAPTTGTPSLLNFFIDRTGDVAPDSRVAGSKTGLVTPAGLALTDSDFGLDTVWVTDSGSDRVSSFVPEFGPANQAPDTSIHGVDTGLSDPSGVAVDALGRPTVANAGNQTVARFGANATGNAQPTQRLTSVGTAGSPNAIAVLAAAPGAPTHVHVVVHPGGAHVTWHAPAVTGGGLVGYDVLAFPIPASASGGFVTGANVNFTTHTSFAFHHLVNGLRYGFEVDAVNDFGTSESDHFTFGTPVSVPTAPRGVTATRGGVGAISVFWARPANDSGKPITHYRLEYATCLPGAKGCAFKSHLVGKKERHATIKGLTIGAKYDVRVLAHNKLGDGTPSKVVTVTTG
jgi:hypothetical protein